MNSPPPPTTTPSPSFQNITTPDGTHTIHLILNAHGAPIYAAIHPNHAAQIHQLSQTLRAHHPELLSHIQREHDLLNSAQERQRGEPIAEWRESQMRRLEVKTGFRWGGLSRGGAVSGPPRVVRRDPFWALEWLVRYAVVVGLFRVWIWVQEQPLLGVVMPARKTFAASDGVAVELEDLGLMAGLVLALAALVARLVKRVVERVWPGRQVEIPWRLWMTIVISSILLTHLYTYDPIRPTELGRLVEVLLLLYICNLYLVWFRRIGLVAEGYDWRVLLKPLKALVNTPLRFLGGTVEIS